MPLFTPATDRALNCDAYLIDTARPARLLRCAIDAPVIDAVLEAVVLMGRSLYDVRDETFALFCGPDALAVSAPVHPGVLSLVRGALGNPAAPEDGELWSLGLDPLLGYERGTVSFFLGPRTRPWVSLAGQRGLRILSATTAHQPDADVFVGDLPATEYIP